jgi:type IV secretory pathway VirB10-like protein
MDADGYGADEERNGLNGTASGEEAGFEAGEPPEPEAGGMNGEPDGAGADGEPSWEEAGFEAETPEAGQEGEGPPEPEPGGMNADEGPEEEERYETTADEATGFKAGGTGAAFFDRKKVTMALCAAFAIAVGGGFFMNLSKNKKEAGEAGNGARAANGAPEFLRNQLERARNAPAANGGPGEAGEFAPDGVLPAAPEPAGLPAVSWDGGPSRPGETESGAPAYAGGGANAPPPPQTAGAARQGGSAANTTPSAYFSPLVPQRIEGSLFGGGSGQNATGQTAPGSAQYSGAAPSGSLAGQYPYLEPGQNSADEYVRQLLASRNAAPEARTDGGDFYSAQSGGSLNSGFFLGENALWPGTVIPAVLETAVSTDLPGNVIARSTRNVYDSRTGTKLLVPQGSLLVARYNSSVSYAQSRVQIVWDTLIRPDGFYLDLEGMNGVDKKGMSGQEAEYHENWFEYAKAAGLITLFSVANAKMTEEAAKHASSAAASGIAQANTQFVSDSGGNIVSRALNIQPTLTVENGAAVNVMLNKAVYLPPVEDYPAAQKYTLR